jgi:hypothetical protein
MTSDLLEQLKGMDPAVLTEIVRKDQHDPDLVILDWTVEALGHERVIGTTGGLFRFKGLGQSTQGICPWAVVLKCINNPKPWAQDPREWAYWRREVMAFHSGFLEQLPPGVRAPHCYGVMENENGTWVWIEHIQEATGEKWALEDFKRTARQLGRFQGAYLNGTPLNDQPWLCQTFFRNIWADQGFWSGLMSPESDGSAWKLPVVQRGFDDRHKARVLQLLAEKQRFFDINDRLPQVLCHNDAHRRNFMWSHSLQNGEDELIGVDWAFSGIGAIGNDLGILVGNSMYFFEYDPTDAETLETALLESYLAGIADTGVVVDARLVRLGYLISISFWMGIMLPGWTAIMLRDEAYVNVQAMYGHPAEDVLTGWVQLHTFCLDRADEARTLIDQLGL